MARKFKELEAKMSPQAIERSNALADAYLAEMALDELREARDLTQAQLAKKLDVDQGAVSRMERRTDMYVSTLRDVIQAMGGELHIIAEFPHGSVEIKQFDLKPKELVTTRRAGSR
jgi:transcriptional regulator with XRE-family HTH domain